MAKAYPTYGDTEKQVGYCLRIGPTPRKRVGSLLTPIGPAFKIESTIFAVYECGCEEKTIQVCTVKDVLYSKKISCGCARRKALVKRSQTHGYSGHPLYRVFHAMNDRCTDPSNGDYIYYGERGIYVCKEWQNSPETFIEWAFSHDWKPGLEIDRINNDGPYSPDNCHFVTHIVNCQNTRRNTRDTQVTAWGETKTLREWEWDPRALVCKGTIRTRLRDGWDAEEALSTPAQSDGRFGIHLKLSEKKAGK